MAVAQESGEGIGRRHVVAEGHQPVDLSKRGSRRTLSGGAKCSAGSTNQRGMATALATSSAPSTRAETTWEWIWGWASPPIEPTTTHGRPARKSIPGRSVWSVRFDGARTFGWSGSRLKNEPRFW